MQNIEISTILEISIFDIHNLEISIFGMQNPEFPIFGMQNTENFDMQNLKILHAKSSNFKI